MACHVSARSRAKPWWLTDQTFSQRCAEQAEVRCLERGLVAELTHWWYLRQVIARANHDYAEMMPGFRRDDVRRET
jgi:hypothetical protein